MSSWTDFFYQRTADDNEVRIVYKSYAPLTYVIYTLTAFMMYGFFYRLLWSRYVAAAVIVMSIALGIIYSPCERLLREAAMDGRGRAEGKKLSIKKPYTIVVQLRKRRAESQNAEDDDTAQAGNGDGENQ